MTTTEIESDLNKLFKKIIKNKKLIESGKMYDSISFKVVKSSNLNIASI